MEALFFVLSIAVSGVFGGSLSEWKDCGSKLDITGVRITGCTEQPCVFNIGEEYTLELDGMPTRSSTTLPYSVKAQIFFPFTMTILEGDACNELTRGACPIFEGGKPFTFTRSFVIQPSFPTPAVIPTTITSSVTDDSGDQIICNELDVLIKTPAPVPMVPTLQPSPPQAFVPSGWFNSFWGQAKK